MNAALKGLFEIKSKVLQKQIYHRQAIMTQIKAEKFKKEQAIAYSLMADKNRIKSTRGTDIEIGRILHNL